MDILEYLAQRTMYNGNRIVPYFLRQSNPVTGAPLPSTLVPAVPPPAPADGTVSRAKLADPAVLPVIPPPVPTGAWTSWTPVFGAFTGSFTSATSNGRYHLIDKKTLVFNLQILITTNGTAAGYVLVSLPSPYVALSGAMFVGRDWLTGKMLQGAMGGGTAQFGILLYDNNYPAADGSNLTMSGVVEIT